MSKRLQANKSSTKTPPKRRKSVLEDYFETTLKKSGLSITKPPESCTASYEIIVITRNLKKNLEKHGDFPENLSEFFDSFVKRCQDLAVFKHYLFPNIVRKTPDDQTIQCTNDSVVKILLAIPLLQNKLIDYIFERAIDLAADSQCGPWIQMILKSLCTLDNMMDSDKIATNIINLLDVASEKMVRLEIITAIPDIIGDQAHDNIATEMSRILQEDNELIPGILDCLSYLCLSDEQFEKLQNVTLNILKKISNTSYFPNFVKFLLGNGKMTDAAYMEVVEGLRNALSWPSLSSIASPQDIASSQVLTAQAIRTSMVSSKSIANAWMKLIANCKINTDHKSFDFIIILILFSTSDEKHKQLENITRKQIKLNIFTEDLLDEAFDKFKPIVKEYLKHLILLTNSFLKTPDAIIQSVASHIYALMFANMEDYCHMIVAELLQHGLDCKHSLLNILTILNNVATKNMSALKQQSVQMLTLLDRKDDMTLNEIRAVMNLVCGLAYSYENSVIRGEVHMIIRKYLGRSNHIIKFHGILAGIHAVKYLMASTSGEHDQIHLPDDISYSSVHYLPEGNLREAAQIIELISCSTREFPKMIAFFYDEFCKIIQSSSYINKHFLQWITDAVTNDLEQNFIVNNLQTESVEGLRLSLQYCLNAESEIEDVIAIDIAGITLQEQEDVNILILPPLFQLVQTLHTKQDDGNLSKINALLGCPVVMPAFDMDLLKDESISSSTSHILDCQIHCVNWFRELLNAFSPVTEHMTKLINRVHHVQKLESLITEILIKSDLTYQPPSWVCYPKTNNANEKLEKSLKKQPAKRKEQKNKAGDDSVLPESVKSQATQKNTATKTKYGVAQNIQYRVLNLKVIELLNEELKHSDSEDVLTVKTVTFILSHVNKTLEYILPSKIKKNTFFNKQDTSDTYEPSKAEDFAKYVHKMLPKIVEHLQYVTSYLDPKMSSNENENIEEDDDDILYNDELFEYIFCLENMYNFFTIYFKWIGFKNQNKPLLRSSLQIFSKTNDEASVTIQDLLTTCAQNLQTHTKYCIQLSTAISLIDLLKTLQEYSCNQSTLVILKDTAKSFLSKTWKTAEGAEEKGVQLNQSIDNLSKVFFENIDISELKNVTLSLSNEVEDLKKGRTNLDSYKMINKNNFSILFRNIGSSLHDIPKNYLNKKLTNTEHLELWENVTMILRCMVEITKTLDTRNNITVFFKKSVPVIKLFVTYGLPILQIEFKNKPQEILQIWNMLQKSTRFLQSVCCHSKLKNDKVLMAKIPDVKQLLETLVYKVKAVLALNKCTEAFEMANLKNRNIKGNSICSQEDIESVLLGEDSDSDNYDSDHSSKSASEMI